MICGRRFSFITIASIDFWNDLQMIFLHFITCILPSIIRHTVVYAVWYGVWFLMVWPWFGHSSLNHNEYAVSSAVSRMKMPPVREHASSLIMGGAVSSAVSFNSLAGTQLESKALCGLLKKKLGNTRNLYMDVFHWWVGAWSNIRESCWTIVGKHRHN